MVRTRPDSRHDPSHPVSARHRLRRLAVPALLAALLAVTVAPAAALERMATAATVPAATGDASTMTFSVAPAGAGVVTAGQPLAVAVSARNATGSTIPAAAVRLSASVRPLTTRADVRDWLAASTADLGADRAGGRHGEILDRSARRGQREPHDRRGDDRGPRAGRLPPCGPTTAPMSAATAVSVLVVSGHAGTGALGLVVPITAPPIADGLLSAAQLGDLTSSGGSLRTNSMRSSALPPSSRSTRPSSRRSACSESPPRLGDTVARRPDGPAERAIRPAVR